VVFIIEQPLSDQQTACKTGFIAAAVVDESPVGKPSDSWAGQVSVGSGVS